MKKNPILILAAIVLCLAFSCSGKKQDDLRSEAATRQESAAQEQDKTGSSDAGPSESVQATGDWEESFTFVRDGIRTEPSRFPLKTPDGVRWGRSGNSLEKALLLAQLLQDKGLTVQTHPIFVFQNLYLFAC